MCDIRNLGEAWEATNITELFELVLKRHVVLAELRDIYRQKLIELQGDEMRPDFYEHG